MVEINEFVIGGIGLLSTIASAWLSWFFTRKKYNSEVDHNVIDNMKESLEFYEKLSNDNKLRLNEALKENKKLREDMNNLLQENMQLKKDMEELKNQLIKLTTNICVDLSCQLRTREKGKNKNGKPKDKSNEVKS